MQLQQEQTVCDSSDVFQICSTGFGPESSLSQAKNEFDGKSCAEGLFKMLWNLESLFSERKQVYACICL